MKSKQRQAIQKIEREGRKFERECRQHDQRVKRALDQLNRDARKHHREVRALNSRIRQAALKLDRLPVLPRYQALHSSTYALNRAFTSLKAQPLPAERFTEYQTILVEAEQENANNLELTAALLGDASEMGTDDDELTDTAITSELSRIAHDLDRRWRGALHALHPHNPEAARHFCTSCREIFTAILHSEAPDEEVFRTLRNCDTDQKGRPTRRARIRYCLRRKDLATDRLEEFVEKDIKNVIDLFDVLSAGTHGSASKYGFSELIRIKKRVEDAILFLAKIVR